MDTTAAQIADEHEALLQFLYMAPVGLVQTNLDGTITMMNPVAAQLLMPLAHDATLTNLFAALEDVAPELRQLVAGFTQSRGVICDPLRMRLVATERGRAPPQMLSLGLFKLDQTRLMGVLNDVTLQVIRERARRRNEAWFNAILTGITDYALLTLDTEGRIDNWNASIGRVTGFSREDVLGQHLSIIYPEGAINADRVRDRLHEADRDGWSLDEGWRVKADGTHFWASAMIAPLHELPAPRGDDPLFARLDGESAYSMIVRDITDRRDASEAHRRDTSCDHLTGIANRRAFFEAAEIEVARWMRSPRDLSLIIFDVDHFKRVNDTFGHPVGDVVLCHLSSLLASTFRPMDVVARLGGEEFVVLLPSTDILKAIIIAERLRLLVSGSPVDVEGKHISYTLSGGAASMEHGIEGLDTLIRRADRALYDAKHAGRNRIMAWSP